MSKLNTFRTFTYDYNDDALTMFRRSVQGHGGLEDLKDEYSYSNEEDVDEIFGIIENFVYLALVTKKMNEYDGVEDDDVNDTLETYVNFIKATPGLMFVNGGFELDDTISKKEVISKFITTVKK